MIPLQTSQKKPPNYFSTNSYTINGVVYDFWVVEYSRFNGKLQMMEICRKVLIKGPEGMSGGVRVYQLVKEGKLVEGWSRIRMARVEEIQQYVSRYL